MVDNHPQLIGIEEPENYLHPRLLTGLVDACRIACMTSQFIITTYSPRFVNELYPDEVWVLYRDEEGFTVCKRANGYAWGRASFGCRCEDWENFGWRVTLNSGTH